MNKVKTKIYTRIFILIFLIFTQLCNIKNDIYAADTVDIHEVEASLGIKQKVECTKQPCAIDVDDLLDVLKNDMNERKEVKLTDTQKEINDSKNLPLITTDKAELIVLNKITAKSTKKIFHVGEVQFFSNLSIEIHKCIKNSDPFNNNDLMLLTIFDNKIEDDNLSVFHGWIFSSNPSISTLEHPVYEVIPIGCITKENS